MNSTKSWRRPATLVVAMACLFALAVDQARAASRQDTIITVSELCSGCVSNIKKRLKKLPEVSYVSCNMATKTVTVVPKSGKSLSPRVLWEAMQGVGNPPEKLVGPSGTYTSKPKQ